jgi:hypothetical protein
MNRKECRVRKSTAVFAIASGFVTAILASGGARAQGCAGPAAMALPTQITPVTLHILQSDLIPVRATDGLVHLAYAAQLTNVSHDPATLNAIVPTDPRHGLTPSGTNEVVDMDGREITGMVLPFMPQAVNGVVPAKSSYGRQLQSGGSGTTFFDVRYRTLAEVPNWLSHRLTVQYPGGDKALVEDVNPIRVGCRTAVVVSPPLVGSGWWDGNGCCRTVGPHRGATLPVNGTFRPPEQFATDFVQLTAQDGCCTGPVKDLQSWPFFGAPILAAADGVVVDRVDGMAEQVPGEVKGITAQNATGNSIIEEIGGGRYVLYAHLKTGSIPARIVVGTRLRRGQQIGAIGNTGSSTAPHLHFQVMDRPSALNAVGLPFVFDRQVLEGQVAGTANRTNEDYEAGGRLTVARGTSAVRLNEMPAEGQVFGYNLK